MEQQLFTSYSNGLNRQSRVIPRAFSHIYLPEYIVFQSYALSHAAPTLRQSISANFLPTICRPAGSLTSLSSVAGTNPTGIDKAGCPVPVIIISGDSLRRRKNALLSYAAVLPTRPTFRDNLSKGPWAGGSSSNLQGGEGNVGMTKTSTDFNALSYSSCCNVNSRA